MILVRVFYSSMTETRRILCIEYRMLIVVTPSFLSYRLLLLDPISNLKIWILGPFSFLPCHHSTALPSSLHVPSSLLVAPCFIFIRYRKRAQHDDRPMPLTPNTHSRPCALRYLDGRARFSMSQLLLSSR